MRGHAFLLAAAHFALSASLSVPRSGLMAPKKAKNPGGFAGELGLFGDGATDRAKHLAEKLKVDVTDLSGSYSIVSALRKATSDEAVRQAHAEAVRDATYPTAEPKEKKYNENTSYKLWNSQAARANRGDAEAKKWCDDRQAGQKEASKAALEKRKAEGRPSHMSVNVSWEGVDTSNERADYATPLALLYMMALHYILCYWYVAPRKSIST